MNLEEMTSDFAMRSSVSRGLRPNRTSMRPHSSVASELCHAPIFKHSAVLCSSIKRRSDALPTARTLRLVSLSAHSRTISSSTGMSSNCAWVRAHATSIDATQERRKKKKKNGIERWITHRQHERGDRCLA